MKLNLIVPLYSDYRACLLLLQLYSCGRRKTGMLRNDLCTPPKTAPSGRDRRARGHALPLPRTREYRISIEIIAALFSAINVGRRVFEEEPETACDLNGNLVTNHD